MARRTESGVTIRAVAQRAGVSAMTVSNVLNRAGRVSAATEATVQAAIAELGYVPNLAARRLAKSRATTVGLLYSNRRTPFLDAVLVGALRATNAHGLQLILRDGDGVSRREAEGLAQDLVRSGADALLLIPPFAEQLDGSDSLRALGVPLAAIATGTAMDEITTVRIDNRTAMQGITRDVVAKGHRRIAYVAGPAHYSVVAARLEGFRAALEDAGVPEDLELIYQTGEFDYDTGRQAARVLLSRSDPPTAIICSSDDLAAGVVAEAIDRGLQLPGDLSVTGFDDTILASRLSPALTVVSQPVEEMAFRAARCLIAALDGNGFIASDQILDHAIVRRASVARPAKST
ncbi:LacI family DNA-binding transcriptional regulator [Novosphingobium lindaniclasticum]|uniref:HTH lacI-type domain-containing protein n=1 Tax=Novosphingobium lindaniclasticum LE124 TaxID=1096930 RepID=T0IU62_9SPHN|nr:substrate-binding domain-containing protein [Novosphingobium lindaniclasticum]EQB15355.1 hypothetical protein L284_12010 [Novosphingobium lindaniclasticum LE124]